MRKCPVKGVDDLQTMYPDLAKEWHPMLNGMLQPYDFLPGSGKKVAWQCAKCGYIWEATIANRAKLGRGCPCCANKVAVKGINDLATTDPEVAKEWYQPLNGHTTPYDVTHGCGKKFYWMCPRGHIYVATVLHRTNGVGTGCPICNSGRQTSFAEQALFFYIKKAFSSAINSYKDIFIKGMELDIFIPELNIGIEYDGVYWHHKKLASYEREQRKYDICKEHGIRLFRVREKRRLDNENPPADWNLFISTDKPYDEEFKLAIKQVLRKIYKEENITGKRIPNVNIKRDRFEILSYLKGPVKNSVQEVAPELLKEWDYEKNGRLMPDMISGGSSQPVYWICSSCNYHWETQICKRVKNHTGCPRCAGLVFEKGVNDLKTKKSELLLDWDYDANSKNGVYPDEIIYNSGKSVKWKCHICGHRWSRAVRARAVDGDGCIMCGYKKGKELKRKRILEKQGCIVDPLLLKEWDYAKNSQIGLFPEELHPGSSKMAYWTCSRCGYKWKAPISRRNNGAGCRKCADKLSGDLRRKTLIKKGKGLNNKLLIKEWDYELNSRNPWDYTVGSKEKVHWICSKCGYKWEAVISNRSKGVGCPACAGNVVVTGKNDLASQVPKLLNEWDYQKNGEVDPSKVAKMSNRKVWWKCLEGHESYLATPSHRVSGTGCPICASMRAGEKSWKSVDQLSLDGEYIKSFKSLKEASMSMGLSNGAISNAIRKGTTSGGYRWRHHITDV